MLGPSADINLQQQSTSSESSRTISDINLIKGNDGVADLDQVAPKRPLAGGLNIPSKIAAKNQTDTHQHKQCDAHEQLDIDRGNQTLAAQSPSTQMLTEKEATREAARQRYLARKASARSNN